MKILQVNCVYRKGSTGKIMYDIHSQLPRYGFESVVCYGRGNVIREKNVYKTCGELYAKANKLWSMVTGIMYGGCILSTNRLVSIIKKEAPDVVHLHCINGNFVNIYRIVNYLKKHNIKTVLTLHAEFMYTGGCSHALECSGWKEDEGCKHCSRWKLETGSLFFNRTRTMWRRMRNAFSGFGEKLTIVSVSPWLKERAEIAPILSEFNHDVVLNGLDCTIFRPHDVDKLRKQHGLTDEKIIFHATPKLDSSLNNIKGGYYVLKLAEELKEYNVKFFIAGDYGDNIEVSENVVLLGRIANQEELATYYSMADVTVLTSKKETFSMVVAESLCCGTPVVGFQAGAPERITIEEYSEFTEFGNMNLLKMNVLKWLDVEVDSEELYRLAKQKYAKDRMICEYINAYKGI